MTRILTLALAVFGLVSFSVRAAESPSHGVDLTLLDQKTSPCDDFYQYSCGGWLARTQIPADRPMWNRSFSTIQLNNLKTLNGILKDYAAGKVAPPNPYARLLGDFYGSCMDEKAIEKDSLREFRKELEPIDRLKDRQALAPLLAKLQLKGVNALFSFGQEQDAKDSTEVIGVADQGGMGLPDREYYLSESPKMVEIRKLYRNYIGRMFGLLGDPNGEKAADTVMKVETELARAAMPLVDRRDPTKVYHRLERKGLAELTPDFDWNAYFDDLDPETTAKLQAIDVAVPGFFTGLQGTLKNTPLPELKTYLKWRLLSAVIQALPRRFVEENFRFTSRALSGQKEIEPRWKRCIHIANAQVGFALGRSFVEVAYGKQGKKRSEDMVHEIEHQFHDDLDHLSWLDDKTRKAAEEKLSRIVNKIGYPKVWRSYAGLKADRHSFLKSLQASEDFDSRYELDKIGKPVNREEWDMTPSAVNAYYDPQKNEIVFPAGILQYPFFNQASPDTLNYGAIGTVMGHELTHGFDDQGRQFDADGNLRNWWDKPVLEKFERKTACVANEYSGFEILPGVHVNGKLTLGENIADQGGLKLSYEAWKAKAGSSAGKTNGSGPKESMEPNDERKFFIAFAQSWCQKEREPFTRMRAAIDPHSPSRYRVNGVVSQFEPFAKAFGCPAGSKMAPSQRCGVW